MLAFSEKTQGEDAIIAVSDYDNRPSSYEVYPIMLD